MGLPLTFVMVPFILNRVQIDTYGAWATISSLLAVGGLAELGLRTEIVRRVAIASSAGDEAELSRTVLEGSTLLTAFGLILVVVTWATAPQLTSAVFLGVAEGERGDITAAVRILSLVLMATLVSGGFFGALVGIQRPEYENLAGIASPLAAAVATAVALAVSPGLLSLAWGPIAAVVVSIAIQAAGSRRLLPGLRPRLVRVTRKRAREYLSLSLFLLVAQLGNLIDFQFDKIVLSRYVNAAAAANYNIGSGLVIQARTLILIPLALLLAGLSELVRSDRRRAERLYEQASKISISLAALCFGSIAVFAPPLIRAWLGPQHGDAALASQLLAAAFFMAMVAAPMYYLALASGWHGLVAVSAIANTTVNCAASLLLTQRLGYEGALYGSVLGNAVGTAVFGLLLRGRGAGQGVAARGCYAALVMTPLCVLAFALGFDRAQTPLMLSALHALIFVVAALLLLRGTRLLDLVALQRLLRGRR